MVRTGSIKPVSIGMRWTVEITNDQEIKVESRPKIPKV